MKVILVSDYFYPFTPGGAEWSVYELGKSLKKKGINPVIVTLNYGAEPSEVYDGLQIVRIPFFKKLTQTRQVVNPIWQNNPIFFLVSSYQLLKLIKQEKPKIIHVHGKFLIPAALIAGFLSKTPVIVTIRDKQMLCPLGKCFFEKNRTKACNFFEYLMKDFPWFYRNYVEEKNVANFLHSLLGAIWSRLASMIMAYFAKKAALVIAISNSQKNYLETNGFRKIITIYNTTPFSRTKSKTRKSKRVLFVGKLSLGKGAFPLLESVSIVARRTKALFLFAGTVGVAKEVKLRMKQKIFRSNVKFLGPVDHKTLTNYYKNSSVVVMPSIYPEAFGRVALEALSLDVPVVVSDRGGLPEIVEDRITGRVVDVAPDSLSEAIINVLNNEKEYKQNIQKAFKRLKNKFEETPVNMHIKLYNQLSK